MEITLLLVCLLIIANPCFSSQTTAPAKATKQTAQETMETTNDIRIVFSDVDGTLVHYPENVKEHVGTDDNPIIKLPPSTTGMQGIISSETLQKCQELRRSGKKLVLVSGMRSTTLWKRIPFLPRADAYCSEAGGRIYYPVRTTSKGGRPVFRVNPYHGAHASDLEPFGLEEDMEWREKMQANAGIEGYIGNEISSSSSESSSIPVDQRQGELWNFCRELEEKGYVVDTKGYSACFRVNRKQQSVASDTEFEALFSITPPVGLATSVNLGCVDFYPVDSGKKNWYVCRCLYALQKLYYIMRIPANNLKAVNTYPKSFVGTTHFWKRTPYVFVTMITTWRWPWLAVMPLYRALVLRAWQGLFKPIPARLLPLVVSEICKREQVQQNEHLLLYKN